MKCTGYSIYLITNTMTGGVYVGRTTQCITKRFRDHVNAARRGRGREALQKAIRLYGAAAFRIEKIASASSCFELSVMERVLIQQHRSHVEYGGYNLARGGNSVETCVPSDVCVCGVELERDARARRNATEPRDTARRLREWREARGLSLLRLARLMQHVDPSTIRKIERRDCKPSLRVAIEIARVSGIELSAWGSV